MKVDIRLAAANMILPHREPLELVDLTVVLDQINARMKEIDGGPGGAEAVPR